MQKAVTRHGSLRSSALAASCGGSDGPGEVGDPAYIRYGWEMDIDGFVNAIIADPHDDHARLVFADFLEEHGDPRAEMIRLQFQLAEIPRFDPARPRLRKRELALLREHGGFGQVPAVVKVLDSHGGFIDAIELTVARFLKHQDEIFSTAPIRKVVLRSKSKKFDKLRESRHLRQLSSMTLKYNSLSNAALIRFVSDAELNRLQELAIWSGESASYGSDELSPEFAGVIGNSTKFRKLKYLSLFNYYAHGADAVKLLAESTSIDSLESLAIGGQNDESLTLMGASPFFRSVKSLSVSGAITSKGVRALQDGESCRALKKLTLRSHAFDNRHRSVREWLHTHDLFDVKRPLERLKSLSIGMRLEPKTLIDLCKNYPQLEVLELSDNLIDDAAVEVLADSPLLGNLRKLSLSRNRITKKGMIALAESSWRHKRLRLNLRSNRISVKDAEQLKNAYGRTFGSLPKDSWHYRKSF